MSNDSVKSIVLSDDDVHVIDIIESTVDDHRRKNSDNVNNSNNNNNNDPSVDIDGVSLNGIETMHGTMNVLGVFRDDIGCCNEITDVHQKRLQGYKFNSEKKCPTIIIDDDDDDNGEIHNHNGGGGDIGSDNYIDNGVKDGRDDERNVVDRIANSCVSSHNSNERGGNNYCVGDYTSNMVNSKESVKRIKISNDDIEKNQSTSVKSSNGIENDQSTSVEMDQSTSVVDGKFNEISNEYNDILNAMAKIINETDQVSDSIDMNSIRKLLIYLNEGSNDVPKFGAADNSIGLTTSAVTTSTTTSTTTTTNVVNESIVTNDTACTFASNLAKNDFTNNAGFDCNANATTNCIVNDSTNRDAGVVTNCIAMTGATNFTSTNCIAMTDVTNFTANSVTNCIATTGATNCIVNGATTDFVMNDITNCIINGATDFTGTDLTTTTNDFVANDVESVVDQTFEHLLNDIDISLDLSTLNIDLLDQENLLLDDDIVPYDSFSTSLPYFDVNLFD